jgi:hypothetical protein
MSLIVPVPRSPIAIRPAALADLAVIDSLQKQHTHMVGWMPTKQLEGKIKARHVIVAEEGPSTGSGQPAPPVGYCIGHDQYFKRDDVGIIYQMNVVPDRQRGLIGATLVKAMFERAAYGCRLFCCWCAQDIEANYFWESLGFIPLAFRSGSRDKKRIHIFWQRRIREGDTTTPYWFPAQTSAGSIREDRLVLPIPPGTHWRDVMPIVLPGHEEKHKLQAPSSKQASKSKPPPLSPRTRGTIPKAMGLGKLCFAPPKPLKEKPKKSGGARAKVKNDPKHVAAARELRDRWLERVNADHSGLLARGKYEVSRLLENEDSGLRMENGAPSSILHLPSSLAPQAA